MRLCVPVSGSGTNLEAMLDAGIRPDLVITDRPCRGEQVALDNSLSLLKMYRGSFRDELGGFDRTAYAQAMAAHITLFNIELIPMAGFMTFLPGLVEHFPGRLINLHPSLFTGMRADYPGDHAVRDTLAAGLKVTGSTVHIATEVLDAGPPLGSTSVNISDDDDEASLQERLKVEERKLYPEVVRKILTGEIDLDALWEEWLSSQG